MDEEIDILSVDVIPEFGEFLHVLKLGRNGLGAQLFRSVYDHIFVSSTDLRKEYDRYYCVEYGSLQEYLECAHEAYLEEGELEKAHILKFKLNYGLIDPAYEDNILDKVVDAIRKLEGKSED